MLHGKLGSGFGPIEIFSNFESTIQEHNYSYVCVT